MPFAGPSLTVEVRKGARYVMRILENEYPVSADHSIRPLALLDTPN